MTQRRRDPWVAPPPNACGKSYLGSVQGGAHLVGERAKRLRISHGDVGQDLPVDLDAGLAEAVDEHVVAHVVLPRGGVDAHDPEPAEIALLILAIAIRVLPPTLDILLRCLPQLGAGTEGALGVLEDLLLPLEARDVRYGAWHDRLLLRGLDEALDSLLFAVRGDQP